MDLTCKSCISLEVNREDEPPKTDWIFFSSPSGFALFLEYFGFQKNTRIAVLGAGTATRMEEYGLYPDFTPVSTEPEEAIKIFCAQLKPTETVLVPRSEISLQRFRNSLPANQLVDWPFYSNHPAPPEIASDADFLIFTSPSNARAYLDAHGIKLTQIAVAIGEATFRALQDLVATTVLKSETPTEESIWDVISTHRERMG